MRGALTALYAPDGRLDEPAGGQPVMGRAAIADHLARVPSEPPTRRSSPSPGSSLPLNPRWWRTAISSTRLPPSAGVALISMCSRA